MAKGYASIDSELDRGVRGEIERARCSESYLQGGQHPTNLKWVVVVVCQIGDKCACCTLHTDIIIRNRLQRVVLICEEIPRIDSLVARAAFNLAIK
jgi:hypothetical protein